MLEHKENPKHQVHSSKNHEVSPTAILPAPPSEQFYESLPEEYFFDVLDFDQRFVFSEFVRRDDRLREEWYYQFYLNQINVRQGKPKQFSKAVSKQIKQTFTPFNNSNYMHFEWWGITVGLNSNNINLLAGTPPKDFRGVLSNLFPNQGTAINIISTGIYTIIKRLERIHSGNGVWIKILYNYKSLRWGLQVSQ